MILAAFDNFWRMNPLISASDFSGKTDLTSPRWKGKENRHFTDRYIDKVQTGTYTDTDIRYNDKLLRVNE